MARSRPLEEMDEKYHDRLRWLEDQMEGIASFLYKEGLEDAAFCMPFYNVQDRLAALIGLPEDYSDYIELDMDPRVVME